MRFLHPVTIVVAAMALVAVSPAAQSENNNHHGTSSGTVQHGSPQTFSRPVVTQQPHFGSGSVGQGGSTGTHTYGTTHAYGTTHVYGNGGTSGTGHTYSYRSNNGTHSYGTHTYGSGRVYGSHPHFTGHFVGRGPVRGFRNAHFGHYFYHGHRYTRFGVGYYHWPYGHHYVRYYVGGYFPHWFWNRDYYISVWEDFGLEPPPPDYVWVRYGPDLILFDEDTGEIAQVIPGFFYETADVEDDGYDDGYDDGPPPDDDQ